MAKWICPHSKIAESIIELAEVQEYLQLRRLFHKSQAHDSNLICVPAVMDSVNTLKNCMGQSKE